MGVSPSRNHASLMDNRTSLMANRNNATSNAYYISNLPQFYQNAKIGDILELPSPNGPYSHYGIYIGEYGEMRHCVVHFTAPSVNFNTSASDMFRHIASASNFSSQGSASRSTSNPNLLPEASRYATTVQDVAEGSENRLIQATELKDLLNEYPCFSINNSNDCEWNPYEVTEIKRRAISRYENHLTQTEYNLFISNCEHFVNDIRYGKHLSSQVETVVKAGFIGIGSLLNSGIGTAAVLPVAIPLAAVGGVAYLVHKLQR